MNIVETSTLKIRKAEESKIGSVDFDNIIFGEIFTDHMFTCKYKDGQWQQSEIVPYGPIMMDPSAKVFHYGQAVFEGMKAYKDEKDSIWLFRPEDNQKRLNISSERLAMPSFPEDKFFEGLEALLKMDKEWIKKGEGNSLYIRPFVIASQSGVSASPASEYTFMIICSPAQSYFSGKKVDIKVLFAEKYSRSADGGVGFAKCAGNYAGQFYPTKLANDAGYHQVVWTDSNTHEYLEEAGVMNVFFRVNDTLLTAPTSDRILDGITRKSVIKLAEDKGMDLEIRPVSVKEIVEAAKNGSLKEMFGVGTAAVVSPIAIFGYKGVDYTLPKIEDTYADYFKNMIEGIQANKKEDKFGWMRQVK
ncbi:MAG: branched-chain amino acid aminotransferase [Flavobacteriaceae bacterium]|nr:branched-chain amino acid aminotransferase [Flavobacteriaceae bacterium]